MKTLIILLALTSMASADAYHDRLISRADNVECLNVQSKMDSHEFKVRVFQRYFKEAGIDEDNVIQRKEGMIDLTRRDVQTYNAMAEAVYLLWHEYPTKLEIPRRKEWYYDVHSKKWAWRMGDGATLVALLPHSSTFEGGAKNGMGAIVDGLRVLEPNTKTLWVQDYDNLHVTVATLVKNTSAVNPRNTAELEHKIRRAKAITKKHEPFNVVFYYRDLILNKKGELVATGFVLDGNLIKLRDELYAEKVARENKDIVHVTLARVFKKDMTMEEFDKYKGYVELLRGKTDSNGKPAKIGNALITKLQTFSQRCPWVFLEDIELMGMEENIAERSV